jgi:hypothetical protein
MKNRLIINISLLVFAIASVRGADPIRFEDYKQLSPEARLKIANASTPELQRQYGRWDQILSMGGQWWSSYQSNALISAKGFDELGGLGTMQVNIRGWFFFQTVAANKKAGMTENQAQKAAVAVSDDAAIQKEWYKDSWWYLVKLAPTPEALALNAKAATLKLEWDKAFGHGGTITQEDLKLIDTAVKQIRDKMRQLPQWTPEQIEAALAALPEEEPHR